MNPNNRQLADAQMDAANSQKQQPVLLALVQLIGAARGNAGYLNPRSASVVIIAFLLCTAAISGMLLHVVYQPGAQLALGADGNTLEYLSLGHPDFGMPAPVDLTEPATAVRSASGGSIGDSIGAVNGDFKADSARLGDLVQSGEGGSTALMDQKWARLQSAVNNSTAEPNAAVTSANVALPEDFKTEASVAFISVWRDIVGTQPYGAYIRHIHRQSTGMLFIILPLYLLFIMFDICTGRWRGPSFYTALALAALLLMMGFTGSILPWSVAGNAAAAVAAAFLAEIPLVGESFAAIFSGGAYVGEATLPRVFSLHTVWLPVLIVLLLLGRLIMKKTAEEGDKVQVTFEPWQVIFLLLAGLLFLVILWYLPNTHLAAFSQSGGTICFALFFAALLQRRLPRIATQELSRLQSFKHFALSAGTLITFVAFGLFLHAAGPTVESDGELVPANQVYTPEYMEVLRPAWYMQPLQSAAALSSSVQGSIALGVGIVALLIFPFLRHNPALKITARILLALGLALAAFYSVLLFLDSVMLRSNPRNTEVFPTLPNLEAWLLPGFMAGIAIVIGLVSHGLNKMLLQQHLTQGDRVN